MPAPAVIPALVAYVNTVVVKTLVVGLRAMCFVFGVCLSLWANML